MPRRASSWTSPMCSAPAGAAPSRRAASCCSPSVPTGVTVLRLAVSGRWGKLFRLVTGTASSALSRAFASSGTPQQPKMDSRLPLFFFLWATAVAGDAGCEFAGVLLGLVPAADCLLEALPFRRRPREAALGVPRMRSDTISGGRSPWRRSGRSTLAMAGSAARTSARARGAGRDPSCRERRRRATAFPFPWSPRLRAAASPGRPGTCRRSGCRRTRLSGTRAGSAPGRVSTALFAPVSGRARRRRLDARD